MHLFGDVPMRWNDDYFPFTEPSFELEVYYNDAWLEVLGCGVIHPEVLDNAELSGKQGWAFGLGLERLAMVLFGIPDIRLFWSTDPRFQSQFTDGKITTFFPYSKYPSCYKDVSFWLPEGSASAPVNHFHSNDVYEVSALQIPVRHRNLFNMFKPINLKLFFPLEIKLYHCYFFEVVSFRSTLFY